MGDDRPLRWRTSTTCDENQCVAVAFDTDRVLLRRTPTTGGPTLTFTPTEWRAFLAGVRNGEFDYRPRPPARPHRRTTHQLLREATRLVRTAMTTPTRHGK